MRVHISIGLTSEESEAITDPDTPLLEVADPDGGSVALTLRQAATAIELRDNIKQLIVALPGAKIPTAKPAAKKKGKWF